MKPRELEKELLQAGWKRLPRRGKSSHRAHVHPDGKRVVTIPWHREKDIRPVTEQNIRKNAGLIRDEEKDK